MMRLPCCIQLFIELSHSMMINVINFHKKDTAIEEIDGAINQTFYSLFLSNNSLNIEKIICGEVLPHCYICNCKNLTDDFMEEHIIDKKTAFLSPIDAIEAEIKRIQLFSD